MKAPILLIHIKEAGNMLLEDTMIEFAKHARLVDKAPSR